VSLLPDDVRPQRSFLSAARTLARWRSSRTRTRSSGSGQRGADERGDDGEAGELNFLVDVHYQPPSMYLRQRRSFR